MRGLIILLALSLVHSQPAYAADCTPKSISISAPSLSGGDENDFLDRFRRAYKKACTWWGNGWSGPIRIEIEDSRGASMALIPGWRGDRGTMIFRTFIVRRSASAILHEVVHLIAPNGNRFLAEGMAVYAHEHLDGQRAYPNNGRDLHRAAREYAEPDKVVALSNFATPSRLRMASLDQRESYLVAGSFVRYLVETHGIEKFRALYALTPIAPGNRRAGGTPARWQKIYGKSINVLARDWVRAIKN